MDALAKEDCKEIRCFIDVVEVKPHEKGGTISFGITPEVYKKISSQPPILNPDYYFISYMIPINEYKAKKKELELSAETFCDHKYDDIGLDFTKGRVVCNRCHVVLEGDDE